MPDEPVADQEQLDLDSRVEEVFAAQASDVAEDAPTEDAAEEATEEAAGEPSPEPAGEPETPPAALTYNGRDYTSDQIEAALAARDWFDQLTPEQARILDATLSGQYQLIPAGQEPPQSQVPPQGAPAVQPAPSPPVDTDEDWLDPRAKAEITQLRARLDELQQSAQQQAAQHVEEEQRKAIADITMGVEKFNAQFGLTESESNRLQDAVWKLNILPSFVQQSQGDVASATERALEVAYWNDPDLRSRAVQWQIATDRARATDDAKRTQKASAVSGTSAGSPPRQPSRPGDPDSKRKALIDDVAAAIHGQ